MGTHLLRVGLVLMLALAPFAAAHAAEMDTRLADIRKAMASKDFKATAKLFKEADKTVPSDPAVVTQHALATLWFYRGVAEHLQGDPKGKAMDAWRQALVINSDFQWDTSVLDEGDPQSLFEALRSEVRGRARLDTGVPEKVGEAKLYVDGVLRSTGDQVVEGQHLLQIVCPDGKVYGAWSDLSKAPSWLKMCPDGVDTSVVVAAVAAPEDDFEGMGPAFGGADEGVDEPVEAPVVVAVNPVAKAAELAAAKKAADAAAAKKAADEATAKKAADAAAAKKAADEAAAKKAADEAVAKKAAEDAAAKKAADDAVAKKAAAAAVALKAGDDATAKKAAEDAAKAVAVAAAKKAAEDAAKKAAEVAAAKKTADDDAAKKADASKTLTKTDAAKDAPVADAGATDAPAKTVAEPVKPDENSKPDKDRTRGEEQGRSGASIGLLSGGGVLILGGTAVNFLVVNPTYDDIVAANDQPGSIYRDDADALTSKFNTSRYATIGLFGAGVLALGGGLLLDAPVVPVVGWGQLGLQGTW